jgi:hypothetical protein
MINVRETIGGPLCIATEDADRVRERIWAALRRGCRVTLSFWETGMVIPAFVSSAVGQLYGEFTEAQVDALVACQDLPAGVEGTAETTRRWAKAYYRDPSAYQKATEEVLEE